MPLNTELESTNFFSYFREDGVEIENDRTINLQIVEQLSEDLQSLRDRKSQHKYQKAQSAREAFIDESIYLEYVAHWKATNSSNDSQIRNRPYILLGNSCNTPQELAQALIKNWDEGIKRLYSSSIINWIQNNLKNDDLFHEIVDIKAESKYDKDLKLMLAIAKLNPKIEEPIYREYVLNREGLLSVIESKNSHVISWLYQNKSLSIYGKYTGKSEYILIDQEWQDNINTFRKLSNQIQSSVDVNNILRLEDENLHLANLLKYSISKNSQKQLREVVRKNTSREAQKCDWYYNLNGGDIENSGLIELYLMHLLESYAHTETKTKSQFKYIFKQKLFQIKSIISPFFKLLSKQPYLVFLFLSIANVVIFSSQFTNGLGLTLLFLGVIFGLIPGWGEMCIFSVGFVTVLGILTSSHQPKTLAITTTLCFAFLTGIFLRKSLLSK